MAVVTMKQLLEAGVHFGHQTRRWNPKMRRFIFTERNGIYIIDLIKSLEGIEKAYQFVRSLVAKGGIVLFVGTKKQIADAIAQEATRVAMPYVNYRWLGGMLTNFQTMHRRILRLRELESQDAQGILDELPKKEALRLRHELEKLRKNLNGIRDLNRRPDAVFIVDTRKEDICVREARKLRLPVIAIVDTNCDPDEVDFVIPGNDDAIRSCKVVVDAIGSVAAERAAHFRQEEEERRRREEEERQRREAEEQARREAEEQAKREAEEQARREAEEQAAAQAAGATPPAPEQQAAAPEQPANPEEGGA
jgi:small subunit ribosomal protein S2